MVLASARSPDRTSGLRRSSCALRSGPAAKALATGIAGSAQLTCLNLDSNAIAQPGAFAIAAALRANTQLCQLSMQSNPICRDGGTMLLIAVQAHPKLQLDLRHCALFPAAPAAAATPASAPPVQLDVPTLLPLVWTRCAFLLNASRGQPVHRAASCSTVRTPPALPIFFAYCGLP